MRGPWRNLVCLISSHQSLGVSRSRLPRRIKVSMFGQFGFASRLVWAYSVAVLSMPIKPEHGSSVWCSKLRVNSWLKPKALGAL